MSKTIDIPVQVPDKDSIDIMASMLKKLTEDERQHLNAILHLAREQLERENAELRKVCAEAYQVAGCAGAPVRVLDNLSCAANNRPIPHETMLPVLLEEFDEVAELRKKLAEAEESLAIWDSVERGM